MDVSDQCALWTSFCVLIPPCTNRYPPLAVLHPELGRGCLEYRKERAPVARANAQAHGYNGSKSRMLSICVYTCAEKHP